MKFVTTRNITVASTSGHAIAFEKGVPTFVPPDMRKDAIASGAVPVDDNFEFDEPKTKNEAPDNAAERAEMIRMALHDMKERNVSSEFTATGAPKVKVVTGLVGFEVTAAEVADLWNAQGE